MESDGKFPDAQVLLGKNPSHLAFPVELGKVYEDGNISLAGAILFLISLRRVGGGYHFFAKLEFSCFL